MSKRLQALPVFLSLLMVAALSASDEPVQLSESFGGFQDGIEFSDQATVVAGQEIGSITIRGNKRVDGVSLEVLGPSVTTYNHGGKGGTDHVLKLGEREYITSMEVHRGEKNDGKRIFYLSFGTSDGNTISAGTKTPEMLTVTAPEGFQLGGFFGRCGDEIDTLGAIWSRISTDAPAAAADDLAPTGLPVSALKSSDGTDDDPLAFLDSETAQESPHETLTGLADPAASTKTPSASADSAESAENSSSGSADSAESTDDSTSVSVGSAESTDDSSSASADSAESTGVSSSDSADSAESTDDSTSGSTGSVESTEDSSSTSAD
uniref:Jacalin-type lectin domain-containing protein n=1 Tax=Peronospora matthiolae TaxID=2874970 RepID=A0AAV1V557_9STRA